MPRAFFDDVNAIATDCIYGVDGVPGGKAGSCGNWTKADAEAFQDAAVLTVEMLLEAFKAKAKWPLLSIRQDGSINEPLRSAPRCTVAGGRGVGGGGGGAAHALRLPASVRPLTTWPPPS